MRNNYKSQNKLYICLGNKKPYSEINFSESVVLPAYVGPVIAQIILLSI